MKCLMRIKPDSHYNNMTRDVAKQQLERLNEYKKHELKSTSDLVEILKQYERRRHDTDDG